MIKGDARVFASFLGYTATILGRVRGSCGAARKSTTRQLKAMEALWLGVFLA